MCSNKRGQIFALEDQRLGSKCSVRGSWWSLWWPGCASRPETVWELAELVGTCRNLLKLAETCREQNLYQLDAAWRTDCCHSKLESTHENSICKANRQTQVLVLLSGRQVTGGYEIAFCIAKRSLRQLFITCSKRQLSIAKPRFADLCAVERWTLKMNSIIETDW